MCTGQPPETAPFLREHMEYIFSHTLFQSTLYIGIGKDSVGDFCCCIRKSGYALGLAVLVQFDERTEHGTVCVCKEALVQRSDQTVIQSLVCFGVYQIMFFLHGTLFHALNEWQNGIVHAEKSGFRFRNFLRGTIQIFCHIAGGESLVQHCFDAVIFRIYTLFLKLVENVFPFVGDDLHVFRNVAVSDVDEVLEQAVVQYFIFTSLKIAPYSFSLPSVPSALLLL